MGTVSVFLFTPEISEVMFSYLYNWWILEPTNCIVSFPFDSLQTFDESIRPLMFPLRQISIREPIFFVRHRHVLVVTGEDYLGGSIPFWSKHSD